MRKGKKQQVDKKKWLKTMGWTKNFKQQMSDEG